MNAFLSLIRWVSMPTSVDKPLTIGDLDNLTKLIGRRIDLAAGSDQRSVEQALISRLCSNTFQIEVAEPLLNGSFLAPPRDKAFPPLRRWALRAFRLDGAACDYSNLLADVVESRRVSHALSSAPISWSPRGLARALRRFGNVPPPPPYASLREQLVSISRGLANLQVSGEPVRCARLDAWQLDNDALVSFSIDSDHANRDQFCRLDFGIISTSWTPVGTLFLEYDSGHVVEIVLSSRGRSLYSAYIFTGGLRRASWKLDATPSTVIITRLTATPVALDTLKALLLTASGEANANRLTTLAELLTEMSPPPRAALDLSRMLTRHIGGHTVRARDYASWIALHEPAGPLVEAGWRSAADKIKQGLIISLVMILTADDDNEGALRSVGSLRAQIYPYWQLLLFDLRNLDARSSDQERPTLPEDDRVRYIARPTTTSIAEALNEALVLAEGRWIMRASAGDTMAPQALLLAASCIDEDPDVQLIYTDEDVSDRQGGRKAPHFKPDFSPDLLLAQNYIGRHALHTALNVRRLGGWRTDLPEAEDYDLLLRVTESLRAGQIRHLGDILYHNADREGPAGAWATDAQRRNGVLALTHHLSRTALAASVEILPSGDRRVRPALPSPPPKVSLIIPTRDKVGTLEACISSIMTKTTYPNFEILIVDNNSVEKETFDFFQAMERHHNVKVLHFREPFNYSKLNNFAVSHCNGQIIGLVNNDTEVISPDWMDELTGWANLGSHGCVGAMLYYSDGRIQHAGVILGVGGVAGHSHKYCDRGHTGYASRLQLHQNLSAVTGACLFVKKTLYQEVGGLDESLSVAFNDVDLCLKVRALGYRNVFTPHAELYHHESLSRGSDDTSDRAQRFFREFQIMHRRWGDALLTDPFYSKNLSLTREDFALRWKDD